MWKYVNGLVMNRPKIIPRCKSDEEHQITATGHWVPCCNVPQYSSEFRDLIFSGDDFKIKDSRDITSFHKKPAFIEWISDIESGRVEAPKFCRLKCSQYTLNAQKSSPFVITNGQEIEYG